MEGDQQGVRDRAGYGTAARLCAATAAGAKAGEGAHNRAARGAGCRPNAASDGACAGAGDIAIAPGPAAGMTCDACPEPAVVVIPGTAPVVALSIVLTRGETLQAYCLPCAKARGFPWVASERQPRRRPGSSGS